MANNAKRYGNSLLAMTTLRPPDTDRGVSLVHLGLNVPSVITAQLNLWEVGSRGPVDPREAASLLWSTPAAQHLDGRADAWLDVPGVKSLLPGLTELASTDQTNWPANQADLRTLVGKVAPGAPNGATLVKDLTTSGAIDLLNDLVLIFKYAAINTNRPVQTVAELYRLARAILAVSDAPSTRKQVIAWFTAPLVIPRVLTAPSGPPSPRRPAAPQNPFPVSPPIVPPRPVGPRIDLTTPRAMRALEALSNELTRLEEVRRRTLLSNALHDAGVRDPLIARRIIADSAGVAGGTLRDPVPTLDQPGERPLAIASLLPQGVSQKPQVIRGYLYGAPIMLDVAAAQTRTERARHEMALRILEGLPENLRARVVILGVALEDLRIWPDLLTAVTHSPSYLEPIGRSDLLLVRQTTTGYRRAEIAYIENILVGEKREREHTNRVLTRQEFFERVERETEETRDLQVSDKAELSREVSKVVSEDLQAQGRVEVTSRGPTTVVAEASVSYDRSTEEAAKAAESYARETIERAVKRTMERITREARSLFEQETTEVDRHGFERDSKADDHISGLYQYLERISHAKMFWYGERELYDLLIPEPAALIWQLAISRKELHIPIEAPDADLFASLTVANIASKREDVIRAFRVTDMPPASEESRETSMSFSATGSGDSAKYATAKELQIPEGYVLDSATFVVSAEVEDEDDTPKRRSNRRGAGPVMGDIAVGQ
jgi:hypothetical protein